MPITAVKAYKGGHVRIKMSLNVSDRYESVKVEGATELSTADVRKLVADLIVLADAADAAIAKKIAVEARRAAYHDREIAAGRMKVFSFR